jgi:hypothetical protein
MNAQQDLDRRISDFYAREAPGRAPDWVLESVLSTIETTRQRRVLVNLPWRLNQMSGFAKLAAAAVIVVAAGIVGMTVLRPAGAPGPGGPSSPSLSPSSSPSPTATRTPLPSPSPYVPSALTETFTSDLHGYSVSYPTGWATQQATQPWPAPAFINFGEPSGDFIFDPSLADHLFLAAASQPLGEMSLEEMTAALLSADGCPTTTEAIVIDGVDGLLAEDCGVATVASGGRAYLFWLYLSGDDPELRTFEYRPFFDEILATVQLDPEAAIQVAPSSSP